jgi:hypothetical protein
MKHIKLFALSVALFALALAPSVHAQSPGPQPLFNGPAQLTDQEQMTRPQVNGTAIFPTFDLQQEFALAFSLISFPQGGQFGTLNATTGTYQIVPQLFTSPTPALGYATGLGTGQTITQITSKSTAVVMPAPTFTGTITMNNASLANGAVVKFTVTDSAVAASDVVLAVPQQGSITAAAAYLVTCNSQNGSFVVNVYNAGTTETDAIVLNFIVLRASGN